MAKQQQPIIFLRIASMVNYQGVTDLDIPKGAGSYVTENEDGGEVYNFAKHMGSYYGFARIQKGRNINLSNLGAPKGATSLSNVTVVFFAKNPALGKQYIVGWYKNATLYNNVQPGYIPHRGEFGGYLTKCKVKDATLLPPDKRVREVEGPGQTNLWYPENYLSEKEINQLRAYFENPNIQPNPPRGGKGRGWQIDAELRKKTEIAAMDAIADYFETRGFTLHDVHKQNKGWDLEATKDANTLHLEVKGTQAGFNTIELTPNEYKQLKSNAKTFRLCIVSNSLDKAKQQIDIFYQDKKQWLNEKRQVLSFTDLVSARVFFK